MNLNSLLNGFEDKRLAGLGDQVLISMQREAGKDIARRSIPGSIVISLLLSIAALVSDVESDNATIYYTILLCSLLTIPIHLFLARSQIQQDNASITRWAVQFSLLAIATSLYWGVFNSWALGQYGIDITTLIFLLFSAGIASGAAAAIFIWKRLAQMYLAILLVPPIIILVFQSGNPIAIGIGFGFILYFTFLFYQVDRSNKEYWIALLNTKELQVQARELKRASMAKSEFLSSMSHELRTPLNAILGFSQLLEIEETLDSDQKESVHEIHKAGTHLLKLVEELLDLAKIESRKLTVSIEPVELGALAEESILLVELLASERNISIHSKSITNVIVQADHFRLKQVIINLLSNAVKYNQDGGTVTFSSESCNGDVLIKVEDTGIGIEHDQLPRVFDSFNRLGHENTGIEGTGIGLTITKNLVELMGGSIGVESTYGSGSCFWVRLPGGNKVSQASDETPAQRGVKFNTDIQYTVLFIEDNPANLKLMERYFKKYECIELVTAHLPELGLDLARARKPELILLDINLPKMDGYTVLKQLQRDKDTHDIPVIAITANAMPRDIQRGIEAGFYDYLTKPLDLNRLGDIVEKLLEEENHLNGPAIE